MYHVYHLDLNQMDQTAYADVQSFYHGNIEDLADLTSFGTPKIDTF